MLISDAMLAVFPFAEWDELQNRSTFKSDSLCNLILTTYFKNAAEARRDVTHEFDVSTQAHLTQPHNGNKRDVRY